jgi:lipopolysaccharide transport system ATP-binding protein
LGFAGLILKWNVVKYWDYGKKRAGKSTLSRYYPRYRSYRTDTIWSRVASLLEVGTGFNGEMTGRENIYLNRCHLNDQKRNYIK